MAVFKCKMCGGALQINNNESVAVCEYCGIKQTIPKLDDERRANLYDRANHFRRNNEFDKAMGIYEKILNDDNTDAEAYWSLVLCRYGIEYVEDPSSRKRVPTINRAQFTSIFDDDNYRSALKYADDFQRSIYEYEAKEINEIQKEILTISQKEEPFDVFICYKETDNNGRRTPDSVLATELYHELSKEGFKVFFSRITLEDKLGTAYEPYIFAALNSAKVMVVIGTRQEYFNAVWVKNEWSRYLSLIKQGQKKILIPAYRDMDPYDLPEEFSHLQAQDMSKLGFMQDLIRGIGKLVVAAPTTVKETVIATGNTNIAPLLKRAFMFLEDGDWSNANEYCEKVLDNDPECAEAYLGKLMAEVYVKKQNSLRECPKPFDSSSNYQKALRFADDKLRKTLIEYTEYIYERNKAAHLEEVYNRATNALNCSSKPESYYNEAAELFESISNYKDAAEKAKECHEKAEEARKDAILDEGKTKMVGELVSNYESAIKLFESISGWKDADNCIEISKKKIDEIKVKEELDKLERERDAELERFAKAKEVKRKKMMGIITGVSVILVVTFIITYSLFVAPLLKYNEAVDLFNEKSYTSAYEIFRELGDYKDAPQRAESARFEIEKIELKKVEVGDFIKFGVFEQDNNTSNGKEEIEWLVLDAKDDKVLLISKYALYHYQDEMNGAWEDSKTRDWLNNDFLNSAFSSDEQSIISTTTVPFYTEEKFILIRNRTTKEKIFLLNGVEAKEYFSLPVDRMCKSTKYAIANGAGVDQDGYGIWGLRYSDLDCYVPSVDNHGYVGYIEDGCDDIGLQQYEYGVRPTMWIDLSEIK